MALTLSLVDAGDYGMGNETGTYPNYGQLSVGVPANHPTIGDPGLTLVEAQSHFSMCVQHTITRSRPDLPDDRDDLRMYVLHLQVVHVSRHDDGDERRS